MRIFSKMIATGLTILLMACQTTVEEKASTIELAPAEPVILAKGEMVKLKYLKGEDEVVVTVTGEGNNIHKWMDSDGCYGESLALEEFAPSLNWNKCGTDKNWHTGTAKIENKEGELWPLQVGNKASYHILYEGHTGHSNKKVRKCEVESTANISVIDKNYDTYKIVCTDKRNIRTFYYAPSVENVVLRIKYLKKKGTSEVAKLLEVL